MMDDAGSDYKVLFPCSVARMTSFRSCQRGSINAVSIHGVGVECIHCLNDAHEPLLRRLDVLKLV